MILPIKHQDMQMIIVNVREGHALLKIAECLSKKNKVLCNEKRDLQNNISSCLE